MNLYHGTTERSAQCIEKEGFIGSEKTNFATGKYFSSGKKGDVIYVSSSIEEAREYGPAIFEIKYVEPKKLDNAYSETEFYVELDDLNKNGTWERIE